MKAGYEVIELAFERGTLRLACDGDTDEIIVAASDRSAGVDEIVDDALLEGLVGKVIEHAWTMVNHRGYSDAFQVRFIDLETRSEACRQFEVAGSVIRIADVSV